MLLLFEYPLSVSNRLQPELTIMNFSDAASDDRAKQCDYSGRQ